MKAILSFKLPEEREEFDITRNAMKYEIILASTLNYIRNQLKYEVLTGEQIHTLEQVRSIILTYAEDEGIRL